MAAMSYTNLVAAKSTDGSIKNWVNKDTIPSAEILTEAEQWIYERLRVREMITAQTGVTMTIGQDTMTLPTRFRQPLKLMITGADQAEVKLKRLDEVEEAFQYDGDGNRVNAKPLIYYCDGTNIQMDAPADKAYGYRFLHYAAGAPLSTSNESNFLTDRYPRIVRLVCQGLSAEFEKDDEEKLHWLAVAKTAIDEVKAMEELRMFGELDTHIDGIG